MRAEKKKKKIQMDKDKTHILLINVGWPAGPLLVTNSYVGEVVHVTLDLPDAFGARELEAVVLVARLIMDQEEVVVSVGTVNSVWKEGG